MSEEGFDASFYCPISSELMVDPVIDHEGNTYERSQIEQWIRLRGLKLNLKKKI